MRILEREQAIGRPLHEVFEFFSQAENLELMTPPWLQFHVVTPRPITMREGTIIDYRIRLIGVPMRWRSRIDVWEPEVRFVDRQLEGPYATWIHLHEFEAIGSGVRMHDRVEYALPFGPLGTIAHATFVRQQLDAIFAYRRLVVAERFGAFSRPREATPRTAPRS